MFGGGEGRVVKANEAISFEARESETVAIVGESGCGKSTLAKVLLGLETASSGKVTLGNKEIQKTGIEMRDVETVSSIQMVFQNPFDTLNPSHSVGSQIIRTLEKFGVGKTVADRRKRMFELLDLVKLPRAFAERMPRQLSGGQKQRIGVARAFAGNAKVVVADEPVSALDVSVQAAVTELLMDIQRKNKTTMLFISHDLSVVRYIADRVVVMYLGHIVEQGSTDQIFAPPYHPYTEALLSAIPIADTSVVKKHIVLEGDIPSAMNPPPGCPFQTRCRYKSQVPGGLCDIEVPPVRNLGWRTPGEVPSARRGARQDGAGHQLRQGRERCFRAGHAGHRPGLCRQAAAASARQDRLAGSLGRGRQRRRSGSIRRGCVVKITARTAPRPANAIRRARGRACRSAGAARSTTPTRRRRSSRRSTNAPRTLTRRSGERTLRSCRQHGDAIVFGRPGRSRLIRP